MFCRTWRAARHGGPRSLSIEVGSISAAVTPQACLQTRQHQPEQGNQNEEPAAAWASISSSLVPVLNVPLCASRRLMQLGSSKAR